MPRRRSGLPGQRWNLFWLLFQEVSCQAWEKWNLSFFQNSQQLLQCARQQSHHHIFLWLLLSLRSSPRSVYHRSLQWTMSLLSFRPMGIQKCTQLEKSPCLCRSVAHQLWRCLHSKHHWFLPYLVAPEPSTNHSSGDHKPYTKVPIHSSNSNIFHRGGIPPKQGYSGYSLQPLQLVAGQQSYQKNSFQFAGQQSNL